MRVGLASTAKFHFYAMARELEDRGLLHRFVTGYPLSRVKGTSFDHRLVSRPWPTSAMMGSARLGPLGRRAYYELYPWASRAIGRAAKEALEGCDAIIASSACGLEAGPMIQAGGGRWFCDRGAAHIGWQNRILLEEAERWGIPRRPIHPMSMDREMQEYEKADKILVPSQFVKRTFIEEGIPAERVEVLHLGADLTRFSPCAEKSEGPSFLFVGNVTLQKGIPDLITAYQQLPKGAKLTIVGAVDGEAAPFLSKLPPEVEIVGRLPQSDLAERMSRSWALVLPSIQDGFGMVAAEAMACACPVIVSENTGAAELIEPGVTGWIVPARNPEALAKAMLECSSSLEEAVHRGEQARSRIIHLGGWRAYGDRLGALITEPEGLALSAR